MPDQAGLFGRAALVARAGDDFESITELSEQERSVLIYERDHKWNGPVMLWYSIALCAVGAATQGWDQVRGFRSSRKGESGRKIEGKRTEYRKGDTRHHWLTSSQTGSNGANLSFPAEFGIDNGTQRDAWIVGLVNAIIFLTAGLM